MHADADMPAADWNVIKGKLANREHYMNFKQFFTLNSAET